MKKLVWVFGVLFALSFLVPADLVSPFTPVPAPAPVDPTVDLTAGVDPAIVELLINATPEDRTRVVSVYTGLAHVVKRDGTTDKLLVTTGKLATLQARTLTLAIETPGKYPGLDKAIDDVFFAAIGTRDEAAVTDAVRTKIVTAAHKIANSAR